MISLWKLFLKNKRKPIRIRKKSKKGKEIAKMKRSHQASIGDKRFQTSIVSLSLSFVDIQFETRIRSDIERDSRLSSNHVNDALELISASAYRSILYFCLIISTNGERWRNLWRFNWTEFIVHPRNEMSIIRRSVLRIDELKIGQSLWGGLNLKLNQLDEFTRDTFLLREDNKE